MPAYAIGHLHNVKMGEEIVEYLREIDATLAPYGGRFLVHGGPYEPLEGDWGGDLIIIEFPDMVGARRWYESAAYQEILPLRRRNSDGDVILIDGVSAAHRAIDILERAV
ncbi:DUF1330 domain-containing protein [Microbulbifer taiwanensis]|uniref:DUF1330 domain-containing protein n=1 Tax=Microbulbifer taiwanensis TaxID=986746 RepID=A0ABW1YN39_9GAMM|nr:DUF1330 domain-containing protein [Microbulbifer taiwanensis]